jgi:hypothetical protein
VRYLYETPSRDGKSSTESDIPKCPGCNEKMRLTRVLPTVLPKSCGTETRVFTCTHCGTTSRAPFMARTRSRDPIGPMNLVKTAWNGVRSLQTHVRRHMVSPSAEWSIQMPGRIEQKAVTRGSTRAPTNTFGKRLDRMHCHKDRNAKPRLVTEARDFDIKCSGSSLLTAGVGERVRIGSGNRQVSL